MRLFRGNFLFIFILFSGVFIVSCKKPNPTYEVSYSKFKIKQVTITAIPFTDDSGSSWDVGISGYENPDVFVNIEDSIGNIIHDGTTDVRNNLQSSALPISFTYSTPLQIENLSAIRDISVYDDDSPISSNDLIGKVSVKMEDYKNGYPTTITKTFSGITVTITGEWY